MIISVAASELPYRFSRKATPKKGGAAAVAALDESPRSGRCLMTRLATATITMESRVAKKQKSTKEPSQKAKKF